MVIARILSLVSTVPATVRLKPHRKLYTSILKKQCRFRTGFKLAESEKMVTLLDDG
jgi:hypothetical protein